MPKKRSKSKRQEALWGYFFVAPFLLGFVVFMLGPIFLRRKLYRLQSDFENEFYRL